MASMQGSDSLWVIFNVSHFRFNWTEYSTAIHFEDNFSVSILFIVILRYVPGLRQKEFYF